MLHSLLSCLLGCLLSAACNLERYHTSYFLSSTLVWDSEASKDVLPLDIEYEVYSGLLSLFGNSRSSYPESEGLFASFVY